ncbi:glycosyltransferase family 4 protein [Azospirillum sp. ST 5-10]|uniref:glycosyltransferase family 4 protein n=1 Tax=unclassified Azospirillum TaxID=2630922 RepID=UPI003F49D5E5
MRIAFVHDRPRMSFPKGGTGRAGGTESTLYYVARELASRHDVTCVVDAPSFVEHGVRFLNIRDALQGPRTAVDAVVVVDGTRTGDLVDRLFAPEHARVFWLHNAPDSSITETVTRPGIARADAVVCVSHWQAGGMAARLGIASDFLHVVPNCVAPQFLGMFPDGCPILAHKTPGSLAYTSNPLRGLRNVPTLFRALRRNIPGATLKVFGGFYLAPGLFSDDMLASYGQVFDELRATDGVSVEDEQGKDALAHALKGTVALFYPTVFKETCCIAALEAMAAGCLIISTQAGALPETVGRFSQLVPVGDAGVDARDFLRIAVGLLRRASESPPRIERLLRDQVDHVNRYYSPEARARDWERVLREATGRTRRPRGGARIRQALGSGETPGPGRPPPDPDRSRATRRQGRRAF